MLMRSISIIFLILSLTHCKHPHETASTTPQPTIRGSTQTLATDAFTRILVDGNIDVTLYTGDRDSRVILHGDSRSMPDVKITVTNGLLHVSVGKGYPHFGRIRAEIRTRYLTSFSYNGAGMVNANNLQSGMLDLSINNTSETIIKGKMSLRRLNVAGSGYTQISGITGHMCQVKLTGKPHVRLGGIIDISSLNMAGDGWLSVQWIQSNVLKIRAKDHAFIQMAGVVETLDLGLQDNAHFNGRYLRGTHVFAKTFGNSVADISVIKTQHTLASGASNIYFHNLPEMRADFMAWNGSVLDMREWDLPNLKDYTRYNR